MYYAFVAQHNRKVRPRSVSETDCDLSETDRGLSLTREYSSGTAVRSSDHIFNKSNEQQTPAPNEELISNRCRNLDQQPRFPNYTKLLIKRKFPSSKLISSCVLL